MNTLFHPPLSPPPLLHLPPPKPSHQTHLTTTTTHHLLSLLRLSARHNDASLAKTLHASLLKLQPSTHLGNALLSTYLKLGLIHQAHLVFQTLIPSPNVVSFSSLISGLAKSNLESQAFKLFSIMRRKGIVPNEYSFVAILTACIRACDVELGMQVHALAAKMGFCDECVFVSNALMGVYVKCGSLGEARQVFDEMPRRDVASWNSLMAGLASEGLYDEVIDMFRRLVRSEECGVDGITVSTVLSGCTEMGDGLLEGRGVHAYAVKAGLDGDLSVGNALIGFYGECGGSAEDVGGLFERMHVRDVVTLTEVIAAYMGFGMVELAVEVFNRMGERNSYSYNAMLAGFCQNREGLRALDLFMEMVEDGIKVTEFTLSSVVGACGLVMDCRVSEQVHGFVIKLGLDLNGCVAAALVDMCTRCGRMGDAMKLFHQWPTQQEKSIMLTSVICGYARNGQLDEAISIFDRYQSEGIMVMDEVASTSLLGLCGTLGYHELGKQIHSHVIKSGFVDDVGVGNASTCMYTKCWNLDEGIKMFNTMHTHDIVSWNVLLAGYLLHRQGDEALAVWSKMEKAGIKPDNITFILIISAHRHTKSSSVDKCRSLFLSMKAVYDTEPLVEHFASFIGVLGYWGLLDEAEDTISKMPFKPGISVWRALLDSCRIRMNTAVGKRVVKRILAMEPKDPASYILLSNLYSASGRWDFSEKVRDDMRKRGFYKQPGRSWVIHNNKIHPFYARDKSHPQVKDIYSGLDILIVECMKAGYVPDTSFVLHEVEEHQKNDFLYYHSAKLATTYGLLTSKPGKPIRVVKNILLCGDCHTFLKYLSIVSKRAIHVRDSSGFHYFSNGECSCKDYW